MTNGEPLTIEWMLVCEGTNFSDDGFPNITKVLRVTTPRRRATAKSRQRRQAVAFCYRAAPGFILRGRLVITDPTGESVTYRIFRQPALNRYGVTMITHEISAVNFDKIGPYRVELYAGGASGVSTSALAEAIVDVVHDPVPTQPSTRAH